MRCQGALAGVCTEALLNPGWTFGQQILFGAVWLRAQAQLPVQQMVQWVLTVAGSKAVLQRGSAPPFEASSVRLHQAASSHWGANSPRVPGHACTPAAGRHCHIPADTSVTPLPHLPTMRNPPADEGSSSPKLSMQANGWILSRQGLGFYSSVGSGHRLPVGWGRASLHTPPSS